jgi:putative Ca2+/H+ antiporter (TMEM165/GDT1 family)
VQQRHALGLLFVLLAASFGWIAVAAGRAGGWVVALAAAVIRGWLASQALRALRRR